VVLDDQDEPVTCTVYDRTRLLAGNLIVGPAIIEEPASSTLLRPGDHAVVNAYGHLVIDLESASL
jgi:N-methylhydantoinase A/oxoprolinase/acetone carboxylase beta subunit